MIPMIYFMILFMKKCLITHLSNIQYWEQKKTLSTIDRKELFQFRKQYYVPERTAFVVAGDFNRKLILPFLEEKLGHISKGLHDVFIPIQDPVIQSKPELYIKHKTDVSQTQIIIAFKSHSFFSIYADVYDIIGDILSSGSSSRLFNLLRNQHGMSYYNYSTNITYSFEGVFAIHIGVDNKKIDDLIKKIIDELKKIVKKGVTREEVEKAKRIKITSFALGLQTPQDLMNFYGQQETLFSIGAVPQENKSRVNIKSRIESYNSIDLEIVNKVIRDLFRDDKLNIFIYGHPPHKEDIMANLKIQ